MPLLSMGLLSARKAVLMSTTEIARATFRADAYIKRDSWLESKAKKLIFFLLSFLFIF
jgi:hypothetical protein